MRVHVQYQVRPDDATKALVAFIEARTVSVIRQHSTAILGKVATPAELVRQRRAINFAARRNYTVPTEPIIEILSVTGVGARRQVGACLWLPSTEYVDATTGQPPSGQVPRSWAGAIATVRRQTVAWKVDSLSAPRDNEALRCGGRP